MTGYKIIKTVYFTRNGCALADRLAGDNSCFILEFKSENESLSSFVENGFKNHLPILFIGATGIAVRAIAPFVSNKLIDSPVIVIDELGRNVIPILSGHFGGANELALEIAKTLKANPVITTATDINKVFAIDCFARKNGFRISDKNEIKNVSEKLLNKEDVTIKIKVNSTTVGKLPKNINLTLEDAADIYISDEKEEGFTLIPKRLVLGIGCKKDKAFEELKAFVLENFEESYLRENLYAIASIDVKKKENGLIKLAQYFGVEFITFSAEKLEKLNGDFPESEFVKGTVGVSNVCERAAVLGAGLDSKNLILEKKAANGMTIAAAMRETIILKWDI